VGTVEETTDRPSVSTTWHWPGEFNPTALGGVEATASGPGGPVTISVEGQEEPQPGESLDLSPGTYTLIVSAEGYESARLAREVLPGVTTVLDVELAPLLPSEVRTTVAESLVRITYTAGGQEVCRNGFLAAPDGLVLTSLGAVRNVASLRVFTFGDRETFANVPVVASDPEKNLAVLQINTERATTPSTALTASEGQYAWSVYYPGCVSLTSARTRLGNWPTPPAAPVQVAFPLPADAVGAPLIDRTGSFLGFISDPTTVLPLPLTEDLLNQARLNISPDPMEREQLPPQTQKGFPWKWVTAGAAAVGVAAALTLGGGGGGSNGPDPTTGNIKIIWPTGG
jgi:hypothetical protein